MSEHFESVVLETGEGEVFRLYAESGIAMVEVAEDRPFAALERTERLLATDLVRSGGDAELEAELMSTSAQARERVEVVRRRDAIGD